MLVSIIIPVYNERDFFPEIYRRVKNVSLPVDREIIIVDDGSSDGTSEVLKSFESEPGTTVLRHPENRGKGSALRTGFSAAGGDIFIIQDADLEYSPEEYPLLLQPILDKKTSIVYGSRILGSPNRSYNRFYWGGRLLSALTNVLYGSSLTDEPTCYKVFKREVLDHFDLECTGFEFCPEFTAKALRSGFTIHEIPISYSPRKIEEGKKIRWTDGLDAIFTLLKYRILPESCFRKNSNSRS